MGCEWVTYEYETMFDILILLALTAEGVGYPEHALVWAYSQHVDRSPENPELRADGRYHLFVIFAVLDVPLAVNLCTNCSFYIMYAKKKLNCHRETVWRFMSLNILLSHSSSLKVIQNGAVQ